MKPFEYLTPIDVSAAVEALRERGSAARVIAGGQSLLLAMKQREATPSCLVAIGAIPELRGVGAGPDGGLAIGAATSYAELERSDLSGWHREIGRVAGNLADRPVRTMGTIGGAICQADPRFDMPTLVVGVDAALEVASADGVRQEPAADAVAHDGLSGPDALLTTIAVPPLQRFTGVAFEKYRYRTFDAATASVCCAVRVDETGSVAEARVAVGAVGPRPMLVTDAAAALQGVVVGEVDATAFGASVAAEAIAFVDGDSDLAHYKHWLVAGLARDAFQRATSTGRE